MVVAATEEAEVLAADVVVTEGVEEVEAAVVREPEGMVSFMLLVLSKTSGRGLVEWSSAQIVNIKFENFVCKCERS